MMWDILHAASPILHIPGEFHHSNSYPRFRPQPLFPEHFDNTVPWVRLTRLSLASGDHITLQPARGTQNRTLRLNTTHVAGQSD